MSNKSVLVDVPGPVKNLHVVDTADGEVSLAWDEPESDGGSKILAYVVERRDVKRKTWTMATDRADIPEYCVGGLQRDNMYFFRVCARNRVGHGETVTTDEAVRAKNKFGELCFSLFLHSFVKSYVTHRTTDTTEKSLSTYRNLR